LESRKQLSDTTDALSRLRLFRQFGHFGKIFSFRLTWGFGAVPSNHLLGLFSVPAPLFGLLAGSSAGFFLAPSAPVIILIRNSAPAAMAGYDE
jgi:hypothetical protein